MSTWQLAFSTHRRKATREPEFSWLDGRGHVRVQDVPSVLPSDLLDVDRMDLMHYASKSVTPAIYSGDLPNPSRILDIGVGSGAWLRDMSALFPDCDCVGMDINNLLGPDVLSSRISYKEGDILQGLPFPDKHFDFIHQRFMVTFIPAKSWHKVARDVYRACRPGGLANFSDLDFRGMRTGPIFQQLLGAMWTGANAGGADPGLAFGLESTLQNAGFVNVRLHTYDFPVGDWGGPIGSLTRLALERTMQAIRPAVVKLGLYTEAQFDQLIAGLPEELNKCRTCMSLCAHEAWRPA
ncbi:S-adenosyl-L-methionine-dependent methyltransferase [Thamnocephalis sphaerospora]|uniref:S-adenosyl-L-methionine-dependent methyltransferase n=1 Tax=Thamnocephalis sphaerospora TaxID=78915 RepID=A0A4P9XND9_9FUNG|nr:S-adenosyl-L-methionine-dependent methyltransferase [Thamnocephalis sphaerospora]|eukprot:RKP07435.1 S-adenosyl-L-methionine-dependent methyltransferase [Thamnocephalis sphaerospora]